MSTKSNNNAAAVGACFGVGNLAPENQFVKRAQMELAYFSFYARLKQRQTGGAGVVLRFQRVRPRRLGGFQPLQAQEISRQRASDDRSVGAADGGGLRI